MSVIDEWKPTPAGRVRHLVQNTRLAVYREDPLLFLLTLGAAATSIAALLAHLAGLVRMPYTLSFLTAPAMTFLLCLAVWARRIDRPLLVNRLRVGFVAGLAGLLAYNVTRWVVSALLSLHPDGASGRAFSLRLVVGRDAGTQTVQEVPHDPR